MLRKHIKFVGLPITLMLLFSQVCFASSDSSSILTANVAEKILIDFGMSVNQAQNMDLNEKIDLANAIQSNPSEVKKSEQVTEIDELSAIELFVNSSDEFLLSLGINSEELFDIRSFIDDINNKTNDKIMEVYGKSPEQVKLLRVALTKNDNYEYIPISDNVVSTSGNISSSKLYTSLYVSPVNVADPAPNYRVQYFFQWDSSPFYIGGWDEIGFAWGGNLNTKDVKRIYNRPALTSPVAPSEYRVVNGTNYGYDDLNNSPVSEITQTVGCGLLHKFKLSPKYGGIQGVALDYGYTYFTLFQSKAQGYSTKIIARYGHKVPSIGVSSMSFNSAPAINLGWGFDYTQELSSNINY